MSKINKKTAYAGPDTAPKAAASQVSDVPIAIMPRAVGAGQNSKRLDQWRDWYNPLRGQTIANVISLFDLSQAGITAELQWIYQLMERRYPILSCCIDSTNAALLELNWYVRTNEGDKRLGDDFDTALAEDQQAALLERYNKITNVYGCLEHLAMAKYRGYAHVQVAAEGKWLDTLRVLPQWNVCREGYIGDWFWNPRAVQAKSGVVDTSNKLQEECYLIVENRRCINEMALINYLRASMSEKDWDAWVEIYGIPSWIINMPPQIPAGQEDAYREAARQVAAGGGGALPHGSEAVSASTKFGDEPFQKRIEYLEKQIVMMATGGMLTSLSLPQGIGSGATDAHSETFKRISHGRAKQISEEFQKKIDKQILDTLFPGKPHLAFFEFDARETMDVGEVLGHARVARQAGVAIDTTQLAERTGYKLTDAPLPATIKETVSAPEADAEAEPGTPAPPAKPVTSRGNPAEGGDIAKTASLAYAKATQAGFRPLAEALWPLLDIRDPDVLQAALEKVLAKFHDIAKQVLENDENSKQMERSADAAAIQGITERVTTLAH